MTKKNFWLLVAMTSLPFVMSEVCLPFMFENLFEWRVGKLLHSDKVNVVITQRPALMLLGGRVQSLELKVDNALIDQIKVDKVNMIMQNADIPLDVLIKGNLNNEMVAEKINIEAIISKNTLLQNINEKFHLDLKSSTVQLTKDGFEIDLKEQQKIKGNFEVKDNALFLNIGKEHSLWVKLLMIKKEKLPWKIKVTNVICKDEQIYLLMESNMRDIRREKN